MDLGVAFLTGIMSIYQPSGDLFVKIDKKSIQLHRSGLFRSVTGSPPRGLKK
jgi:hypothetical protein